MRCTMFASLNASSANGPMQIWRAGVKEREREKKKKERRITEGNQGTQQLPSTPVPLLPTSTPPPGFGQQHQRMIEPYRALVVVGDLVFGGHAVVVRTKGPGRPVIARRGRRHGHHRVVVRVTRQRRRRTRVSGGGPRHGHGRRRRRPACLTEPHLAHKTGFGVGLQELQGGREGGWYDGMDGIRVVQDQSHDQCSGFLLPRFRPFSPASLPSLSPASLLHPTTCRPMLT